MMPPTRQQYIRLCGDAIVQLCTALALLLAGSVARGSVYAQEANGITVTMSAPAQAAVGESIPLRIQVNGSAALAGLELQLLFDRTAVEFAAVNVLSGPAALGQLVLPELTSGSAFAFYSCSTDACLRVERAQPLTAEAQNTEIEILLIGRTPGQAQIRLANVKAVDPAARSLAANVAQASVTIQIGEGGESIPAPSAEWAWSAATVVGVAQPEAADITQDGKVSHGDLMQVALSWQVVREDDNPCSGREPDSDVNGDGCIDIIDLQAAASFASKPAQPTEPDPPGDTPLDTPELLFFPLVPQSVASARANAVDAQSEAPKTFTVDSTLDESDNKWGDGVCRTASGVCTLRAAIAEANANSGSDTIVFAIPGGGVKTINITERLPTLRDESGGTLIDGYTQPGSAVNSDPLVSNAAIRVEIRGQGYAYFDGLPITSANNTVRGLAFYNLRRSVWVYGTGAHDNALTGNFIGTNAAGTFGYNSTSTQQTHGVHIEQGSYANRIGGTPLGQRNVISGNARHGIGLWHTGTTNNLIINNIVGLSPDGLRSLSNRVHGVDVNFSAAFNTVGGTQSGERNVISGNNGTGVEVSHEQGTSNNSILGNYVGTDATGNAGPAYTSNGLYGVSVKDRVVDNVVEGNVIGNNDGGGLKIDNFGNCCASSNVVKNNRIGIGSSGAAIGNALFGVHIIAPESMIGPGNLIANNPVGIQIEGDANDGNTITRNSIFANVGLGIDIAPFAQVNANDANDADSGANEQLNFPVLESVVPALAQGAACAGCAVEIFIADAGQGQYGEGRTFVASGNAGQNGSFSIALSGVEQGDFVTATATDAAGNTSEFSLNRVVGSGTPPGIPVPGRIQAEDYGPGGPGVSYLDTTSGNSGGAYRNDDVDIEATSDAGGGYNVGWIAPGEWLAYDIDVAATGPYRVVARVATPFSGRKFHIEVDGANVSGSVQIPWTGGWQNWVDVPVSIPLTQGAHVLRFVAETDRFNFNYLDVTAE